MINPHWSYAISFLLGLLVYQLGWSTLYPKLEISLLIFISSTIVLHAALGWQWRKNVKYNSPGSTRISPAIVTIFLYSLWVVEFIYEGGIPLIKILLHQPFNYRLFGVPSLHVFNVTFASFYTVFLFHLYLCEKQRKVLFLFIINLMAALLIYSRAMLIFILVASFIVYLGYGKIKINELRWVPLMAIVILFFFGVLGNIRVSHEANSKYDPDNFLEIGQASDQFRDSWIPKEFFWGYIYISSPLANLQTNINTRFISNKPNVFYQHINNEMLFDVVSKRINRVFKWEREQENTIQEPFNVSTVYSRSFSYQKWTGIFLMAIYVLAFPWIYRWLLPNNSYALTGLAILNTMFLFLVYDNTIRFSGLSLQLVYPLIYPAVEKFWMLIKNKISA